ncbi:MAG: hypothetical protein B6I26_05780 [Desulfobacteraceae bacterium 4572_130]|nr:MAG: hypothetical protein B6I26_05780 [Desulfobacteraceae bacterium 4572_130]
MSKKKIQQIWGLVLMLAGIGVFYRIPQVIPKIKIIETFSNTIGVIKFSFYVLGVLLIFGGIRKILKNK